MTLTENNTPSWMWETISMNRMLARIEEKKEMFNLAVKAMEEDDRTVFGDKTGVEETSLERNPETVQVFRTDDESEQE